MEKQKWNELMTLADRHAEHRVGEHVLEHTQDYLNGIANGGNPAQLAAELVFQAEGAMSLAPIYKEQFMRRHGMIQS